MAAREFHRQRCIGTGSFGKVWLVVYSGNNKTYALKEIKVRGLTSKEINQAITEVKVLSQLGHFNIIRYKQAFVNDDMLNIAMEYAEGGDLSGKIQKQSATGVFFEEGRVLNWFTQICFALKYIHKQNILHRDLKPQNIFLTKTNVVKVGDFGVAKVLLTDSGVAETAIGTPYYISPELCQSKPYNKKSDIWALGCLLYELATLKHAFDGSNFNNLVVKILRGEYGRLPSHYPFHPTSTLIQHMLLQLPEDRPTVDHLLQLPSLKTHITRYEQMVLRLTEEKRAKKKIFVNSSLMKEDSKSVPELTSEADLSTPPSGQRLSVLRRELRKSVPARSSAANNPFLLPKSRPPLRREHSKSVPEQLSQSNKSPRVNNKRRAFSARAGKQQKSDLRRAVILKQAIAWKSSNVSSLNDITSPNLSPMHSDVSHTLHTPTTDEVFNDDSGDQKPCVDACCGAMLAAMGGGHTDKSAEQLFEMLHQRIGQADTKALMAKLENYLEENANISQSHFSMAVIKPFLPESVTSEELLLALNILNVKRQQTQIFMER